MSAGVDRKGLNVKKALLTGGAGFIGAHLTRRLLDEGWSVDLVDNLSRGVKDDVFAELVARSGFTLHEADLRDPDALADLGDDYTHVLHFAALLGVQNVIDRPYDTLRDNVRLLEELIDFGRRQSGLERFVFPSTSEVYVGTQQQFELPIPSPETTPLAVSPLDRPRTSYMLSKIYGEALCHHSGLPFTIVRPHNFYGPRMGLAHVVPQLLQRIHDSTDGDELIVYSVDHMRTFCYIDDAVAYLMALPRYRRSRRGHLQPRRAVARDHNGRPRHAAVSGGGSGARDRAGRDDGRLAASTLSGHDPHDRCHGPRAGGRSRGRRRPGL